jgi:16S rRNA processing protein RimM
MDPRWDELIRVGEIARAHGLRGDIVITPEADDADRFAPGRRLWIEGPDGPAPFEIAAVSFLHGRPIVRFAGVETRTAAEGMAGREVRVAPADLPPLPDGRYYHHELVGCEVVTVDGVAIGIVVGVSGAAGASLLVVDGASGETLVPLAERICVSVDPAAGRIVVDPPEGLIGLNGEGRASGGAGG